jgi:hypothetical protein
VSVPADYAERFKARQAAREAAEVEQRAAPPQTASGKQTKPARPSADGSRWATLNAFVDVIAEHLTPSEQVVWVNLFRNARDGKSATTTRQIAARCGLDAKTVTAALSLLKTVGLVWVVSASRVKGVASVYGLHPHPDRCLQRCMDAGAARVARKARRTPK